jgi:hypothetical protein
LFVLVFLVFEAVLADFVVLAAFVDLAALAAGFVAFVVFLVTLSAVFWTCFLVDFVDLVAFVLFADFAAGLAAVFAFAVVAFVVVLAAGALVAAMAVPVSINAAAIIDASSFFKIFPPLVRAYKPKDMSVAPA